MDNNATEVIETAHIEAEMQASFLNYAMSVIVARALPDIRDGLKPVHRRILYAMNELKVFHNRPYLKSARIVGDVLGKYHPHGDTSVYDALVRMAQDFSMRYPAIDGQGNFGSLDGDAAAAMRYTESRMQSYAEYLLADIDKGTVDFVPNYDNKEHEPVVLPARIPHLLVNGSAGIAVGMATNILPHNLGEIMNGLRALIHNPDLSLAELMKHIPGPDFPGGGEIHGVQGIVDGYQTGRGGLSVRSQIAIEDMPGQKDRSRIVITEIPYMVNKARLVEKIAVLVNDKKVVGISDIRDESSKQGIRVVIDCKKGVFAEVVLNHLYKLTPLQTTISMNAVALVRGTPQLHSLKDMLREFYGFRREVVLRRTSFLLHKAEHKQLILLGLKKAVDEMDDVVGTIRSAADTQQAHQQLMSRFDLLDIQAKAILDMRLARLTGLEREKIHQETATIADEIADYKDILARKERVTEIILAEIDEVCQEFQDERRTKIFMSEAEQITMADLVADVSVVVSLSKDGYIKRTRTEDISSQQRGGKGRSGMLIQDNDATSLVLECTNHETLVCFSNLGRVYTLKVYDIPKVELRSKGKHTANLMPLQKGELIVAAIAVESFPSGSYVVCVTKLGYIKRTALGHYKNVRSNGIIGITLGEQDELVEVCIASSQEHVFVASSAGKVIRFVLDEVRPTGRTSRGVRAIRLGVSDRVVAVEMVDPARVENKHILSITTNGYGKKSRTTEYRLQKRGGSGIISIKTTPRNGGFVGVYFVADEDDVVMMTSKGKLLRMNLAKTPLIRRNTQGVRLMRVDKQEEIRTVGVISAESAADNQSS